MGIIREMRLDAIISRLYVFIDVERPISAVYCQVRSGMEAMPFQELMARIARIVPIGLTNSKSEIDGGNIFFFASDTSLAQDTTTKVKETIRNNGQSIRGLAAASQAGHPEVLMEGLLYYLPPEIVNKILSFISKNSGNGCAIIFDYYPQSVVDGRSEMEVGRYLYNQLAQYGEPLRFGIEDGGVEAFLSQRGFSKIQNVTSEDYKKAYFHGANKDRPVCSPTSFVHAVVE